MENLAYDAILGRDFLQRNKALIDLEKSRITFKQLGNRPSRTSKEIEPANVMGTYLLQTTRQEDKKTSSKIHPMISRRFQIPAQCSEVKRRKKLELVRLF